MTIINNFIDFDYYVSKKKPVTHLNNNIACPFCDLETLRITNDIILENDFLIHIKNKYPTYLNTSASVIIEHKECNLDFSTYPLEHTSKILKYSIDYWLDMYKKEEYKSVMFFKNHGYISGGSIKHPHMQIVGIEEFDYMENISPVHFEGELIKKIDNIEINISNNPIGEHHEFNIIFDEYNYSEKIDSLSLLLKETVDYILNKIYKKGLSDFNLSFYRLNGKIIIKIIPKRPNTIVLIGYKISARPNNLKDIIKEFLDYHNNK